jgi:hypothetical protein
MKLQTVGPPDRGSLSIVYSCPECGYEMAMLTNAYETQVVQSLGVRVGPESPRRSSESEAGSAEAGAGCPFADMIPPATPKPLGEGGGTESAERPAAAERVPIRWTAEAEARLARVPAFVRPMARTGIERFAREKGALEVDEQILDAARDFFGM